jgi:hypothetical protein
MENNLRDEALLKLREAYALLDTAGVPETIQDLLYKEEYFSSFINNKDEEYVEFFSCAVCRSNHDMILSIKKDKSFQYALSIEINHRYHDLSILDKLKYMYRYFKNLFIDKESTNDFLLSYNDLTSFKDILKRIP